jgi:dihydrofolate synthase/folylpolyglutamate synthase
MKIRKYSFKNFTDVEEFLSQYWPTAKTAYSLNRMRGLMGYLGNPQNNLRVVHVAGTSGKTSTAYYCAALLGQTGLKIGLTVSPHISCVNERVQINLGPLPEKKFCREFSAFMDLLDKTDFELTYFELMMAFAFWFYDKEHVDYAVMEVGLGGLLDATNVIDRADKVCIITDIGLDHVTILGKTLPKIATQKAGIIHRHNEVFCHLLGPAVMSVIQKACKENQARLHLANSPTTDKELAFLPLFQQRNFNLAKNAINYLFKRDNLPALGQSQLIQAARIKIPGRMELLRFRQKTIILDGAHNYQKLHELARSIKHQFPGQSIAALIAFSGGRDYRYKNNVKEIVGLADTIIISPMPQHIPSIYPALDPRKITELCEAAGAQKVIAAESLKQAIELLIDCDEKLLLITGSFYILDDSRHVINAILTRHS